MRLKKTRQSQYVLPGTLHYATERLEPRCLLSAGINGGSGDDTFVITVGDGNAINLIFNGVPQAVPPAGDGIMEVHGLGGNDTISLLNTGTLDWFLFGGFGDDHFNVGNGNLKSNILRDVSIDDAAGTGNDTATINDQFGGGTVYGTDRDSIQILSLSSPFIVLQSMVDPGDGATLLGSNGDDTLRVFNDGGGGSPGGLPAKTYLDLGDGDDAVVLGGSQNILKTDLPTTSTIDGGATGNDGVSVIDSNPASTRDSIRFDSDGLVGGPHLKNFVVGTVATHQLAGGAPEPVTFRGNVMPFSQVSIYGSTGDDFVQFGEPDHPIDNQGYWGDVVLELSTGVDTVQINELPTAGGANWTLYDGGLARGTEPVSFSSYNIVSGSIVPDTLDLQIYGTNNNDTFTYIDAPESWNVFMFGNGGNDILQQGLTKDLDDVFDHGRCVFDGGTGTDTVDLNDSQDAIGDADVYDFETDRIHKSNSGSNSTDFLVEFSSVDQLNLICDDDPNIIHYESGLIDVLDIDGGGGNDTFLNRSASNGKKSFASNFSALVRLHGGSGNDILSLDDSDGGTGSYTVNAAQFLYSGGGHNDTLNFDSMAIFELFGSNVANNATLAAKPTGATLNVNTNDGDDTIAIGGGDLNNTGLFTNSGVTVSGGGGNDRIVFDDHLSTSAATYTFGNLTLTRNASTFIYSTFELQTLMPADGLGFQLDPLNTINLNSVSSFLSNTTIVGGNLIPCAFNVGNGDLINVSGSLDVQLGAAGGTVNLNDQNHTADRSYVLTATGMTSPQPMSFSGATAVILSAGSGNDSVVVSSTVAGTGLTIHGNNGNEHFDIGGGNFTNLAGDVTVAGDAGNDTVQYLDTNAASHDSATLTSTALLVNGRTLGYSTVDHLGITVGSGGSTIGLNTVGLLTTVTGGTGDDVVNIGNGSLNSNFLANTQFDGGAGTDTMNLLGQNDSANNTYAFPASTQFRFGDTSTGKFVVFSGIEQGTLQCGSGDDIIDATIITPAMTILSGSGNDRVTITASTTPVSVNTGSEHPANFGQLAGDVLNLGFVATAATVIIPQDDTIINLSVAATCTLRIPAGVVLRRVFAGFIDSGLGLGGTIDLAGGALLWGSTLSMPDFRPFLTRGYNNGGWNGSSTSGVINSSLAAGSILFDGVGYGLGSQIKPTTIGSFTIGPDDMLLRYTLDGDANLNGAVNAADLGILAANWQGNGKVFSQTDFNYDNKVDLMDLYGLGVNFNQSVLFAAPASLPLPLPPAPARAPTRTATRVVELVDP
jgi:hypothetical protein